MHRLATLRTFLPKQRWFSIATRQAVRHNIPFRPAIDPWRMQQPIARRSISQTIQNLKASEKPVKQSSTPGNDATAATSTTESFVMEDDLETLDPKEYPELYPEASEEEDDEQIDTEWFVQEDEHDFVPMWQRQAVGDHLKDRWSIQEVSRKLMDTGDLSVDSIRDLLEENKMENVKVLDVRGRCDWTDYMVIADSSRGDRFLSSVADNVGQVVSDNLSTIQSSSSPNFVASDSEGYPLSS